MLMTKKRRAVDRAGQVDMSRMAVVLFRPQLPENIGAVARAACNMGLERLIVVRPESLHQERMRMMATPAAFHVLEKIEAYDDLASALAAFSYVVGTTARRGGLRRELYEPREMALRLVEIANDNDVALLFGPENWGLTNKELPFCHTLVTIPTAGCASLNLAQAVLILAYELWLVRHPKPRYDPRFANVRELESMYDMLKATLVKIDFISHQNPDYWMMNVRRLFNRHGLRAQEAQVVKGICRQIDWYVKRRLSGEGGNE
jgi:tRNA/rRNA methyltransferase